MAKNILITDADTHIGYELLKLSIKRGDSVIATTSQTEDLSSYQAFEGKLLELVYWNRKSAPSTRNVLLKVQNTFNTLDIALVLKPSITNPEPINICKFATIEKAVDERITGTLFLVKEILKYYIKAKKGLLSLINMYPEKPEESNFLENTITGSFRGLSEGLCSSFKQQDIFIHRFQTAFSTDINEYADFILKTIDSKGYKVSGKHFHFQKKLGFFTSFSHSKRKS